MVTLTVRTGLGILTVSVIVIVVIASGYMNKDMASAFDTWWKPFAIGMGIAVLPLVTLVAIENKAHEKLVGLLYGKPDPMKGVKLQRIEDDDDEDGGGMPEESEKEKEIREQLEKWTQEDAEQKKKIAEYQAFAARLAKLKEGTEVVEEKFTRGKTDEEKAEIDRKQEEEKRGIQAELGEKLAELERKFKEKEAKLLQEADEEEEKFNAKSKGIEKEKRQLEDEIKKLQEQQKEQRKAREAWEQDNEKAKSAKRDIQADIIEMKKQLLKHTEASKVTEDVLNGPLYSDWGKYQEALKKYKVEFRKYLIDLDEHNRRLKEEKGGSWIRGPNVGEEAKGMAESVPENVRKFHNLGPNEAYTSTQFDEYMRHQAGLRRATVVRETIPPYTGKAPTKPKRPRYDPGNPPPPPMPDKDIDDLRKKLDGLGKGLSKSSTAQTKLDDLRKKHEQDKKTAQTKAQAKIDASKNKASNAKNAKVTETRTKAKVKPTKAGANKAATDPMAA